MMDNKKILIAIGLLAVLSVAGLFFPRVNVVELGKQLGEELKDFAGTTSFRTNNSNDLGNVEVDTFTSVATSTVEALSLDGFGLRGVQGSCNDASTTLFAIPNPYGATSTWISATVDVTGESTTSIGINVGTSTVTGPIHTAASTGAANYRGPHLIEGVAVGTGLGYVRSGFTVSTTTSSEQGPTMRGVGVDSGTTTARVIIGPQEYVVGYATGTTAGVTNTNNAFACNYNLLFER